ncbi:MAG TPA: molybdopterin-dependent oxidoreductase [Polyangia bacterium]|nr:molybdopterin-dependent oxidoreductase [Polyangia bacterium]
MSHTGLHTCMLCEAVCGLAVETEGNEVTSIRGDEHDPFSRGHICPKAVALRDLHADPDRVREPLRRVGTSDRFEPVSWDDALAEATEKLAAIQKRHGRHAIALYLGNPTVHSYSALLAVPLMAKALGTHARFSATSVDQLPHMLAALEMFGHQLLLPIPDVDRTSFLLVLGANPLVSNGSIMTAPGIARRLEALRARGGRLVVVDPRRSETAAVADEHLFIRPGGDAYLLLGLLHVLFAEGRVALGRLAPMVDGLDEVRALAARFPPARVAARAGIDAERITKLARELAAAPSAVCYGRVGVCTQEFGGLAAWLINVLNVVTGNLDRAGGAMFTTPAADLVGLASRLGERGHFGVWKSRVRGLPEFGGELPVAALAEEIETPGEGQIRALVTHAGNPVLSTPNGARLGRVLPQLDYMVAIDIYRNETTRHAHLILPTSFGLERDHYDLAFYALSVRNAARYVTPLLAPPPGVRHDWQVILDLGIGLHARGGGRRDRGVVWMMRAMRALGPRRVLDLLLRFGPHKLSLKKLAAAPHGVDLGPLEERLPSALASDGRRIALAPPRLRGDVKRLEAQLDAAAVGEGELLLIGRRQLRSNNSWMHNSARLVKGPEACTLLMHPDDARARGLSDGDRVQVRSRVGAVAVPLALSPDIAVGVVSLPHGWGHAAANGTLRVAQTRAGASINDLTDDQRLDALSGNAGFSGLPVTVARAG